MQLSVFNGHTIHTVQFFLAIFSEWKASQDHSRTNVTYAPVGYLTENESHVCVIT